MAGECSMWCLARATRSASSRANSTSMLKILVKAQWQCRGCSAIKLHRDIIIGAGRSAREAQDAQANLSNDDRAEEYRKQRDQGRHHNAPALLTERVQILGDRKAGEGDNGRCQGQKVHLA